jgi:outer membrane protein W
VDVTRVLPAVDHRGYAHRVKLASLHVAAAVAVASLVASPAAAQEHEHPSLLDRPHTVLNLEAGIIALPNAAISQSNRGGATPLGTVGNGDATLQTGVHILYRANGDWAIGAGALFAPRPTADTNYGGASGLSRTHSRSYLTLGGEARYYPLRSRWFEGWFGLTSGAIVVGDRYVNNNAPQVPSILGNNETTVSTEGFAIGVQIGADYLVTDSWVIGLAIRADRWFLPDQKPFSKETSCDPVGDCPTLTGSVAAFEFGLTVGYRIPL